MVWQVLIRVMLRVLGPHQMAPQVGQQTEGKGALLRVAHAALVAVIGFQQHPVGVEVVIQLVVVIAAAG